MSSDIIVMEDLNVNFKGHLMKKTTTGEWKRRFCEINGSFLMLFKSSDQKKMVAVITLNQVGKISITSTIEDSHGPGVIFEIDLNEGKFFALRAKSLDDAVKWVRYLEIFTARLKGSSHVGLSPHVPMNQELVELSISGSTVFDGSKIESNSTISDALVPNKSLHVFNDSTLSSNILPVSSSFAIFQDENYDPKLESTGVASAKTPTKTHNIPSQLSEHSSVLSELTPSKLNSRSPIRKNNNTSNKKGLLKTATKSTTKSSTKAAKFSDPVVSHTSLFSETLFDNSENIDVHVENSVTVAAGTIATEYNESQRLETKEAVHIDMKETESSSVTMKLFNSPEARVSSSSKSSTADNTLNRFLRTINTSLETSSHSLNISNNYSSMANSSNIGSCGESVPKQPSESKHSTPITTPLPIVSTLSGEKKTSPMSIHGVVSSIFNEFVQEIVELPATTTADTVDGPTEVVEKLAETVLCKEINVSAELGKSNNPTSDNIHVDISSSAGNSHSINTSSGSYSITSMVKLGDILNSECNSNTNSTSNTVCDSSALHEKNGSLQVETSSAIEEAASDVPASSAIIPAKKSDTLPAQNVRGAVPTAADDLIIPTTTTTTTAATTATSTEMPLPAHRSPPIVRPSLKYKVKASVTPATKFALSLSEAETPCYDSAEKLYIKAQQLKLTDWTPPPLTRSTLRDIAHNVDNNINGNSNSANGSVNNNNGGSCDKTSTIDSALQRAAKNKQQKFTVMTNVIVLLSLLLIYMTFLLMAPEPAVDRTVVPQIEPVVLIKSEDSAFDMYTKNTAYEFSSTDQLHHLKPSTVYETRRHDIVIPADHSTVHITIASGGTAVLHNTNGKDQTFTVTTKEEGSESSSTTSSTSTRSFENLMPKASKKHASKARKHSLPKSHLQDEQMRNSGTLEEEVQPVSEEAPKKKGRMFFNRNNKKRSSNMNKDSVSGISSSISNKPTENLIATFRQLAVSVQKLVSILLELPILLIEVTVNKMRSFF